MKGLMFLDAVVESSQTPTASVSQSGEVSSFSFEKLGAMWEKFWPRATEWLLLAVLCLIIYAVGKRLIKFVTKLTARAFER